jgi:hypothetical protein
VIGTTRTLTRRIVTGTTLTGVAALAAAGCGGMGDTGSAPKTGTASCALTWRRAA